MKQGILIIANKNFQHLERIVRCFDQDFQIYIHIDRKAKISSGEINKIRLLPNVAFVSQKLAVNWGSLNVVKSSLMLVREALKAKELVYFHLISGHDFPLKNSQEFKQWLEKNKGKEFLESFKLPKNQPGWVDGGFSRLNRYYCYDLFDTKRYWGNKLLNYILRVQYKLGYKRALDPKFPSLWGGSTWWSLSAASLQYVVNYVEANPWFIKRFKHTFCADELFFQTIIMNAPFHQKVVNNNLRFILWENRNGNMPANLDLDDLPALQQSDALFARKFEYPVSEPLLMELISSPHSSIKDPPGTAATMAKRQDI